MLIMDEKTDILRGKLVETELNLHLSEPKVCRLYFYSSSSQDEGKSMGNSNLNSDFTFSLKPRQEVLTDEWERRQN